MAAADPATGVAGPSLVEALRARKTAVQSISAASNGGRDSQGAVDAYVSRRRAIRRRHSAVNQGRGGRVVARHIYLQHTTTIKEAMENIKRACALGGVSVQAAPVEMRTTPSVPFMQMTGNRF